MTEEKTPINQDFRSGDTVKVFYKIKEEGKERIQPFEGIIIARKGAGNSKTITVRKIASLGIGVERIFPIFSPNIGKIEVTKRGKVRRSKLYYLRSRK
jgi:large subunit ribosomal protein L19